MMKPWTPTRLVSVEEMRALDHAASADFGIAALLLMENAARAIAEEAKKRLKRGGKVLVVCGPGNNGGDGVAAARHLLNMGVPVEVLQVVPEMKGDAGTNLQAFRKIGGNLRPFDPKEGVPGAAGDVVVDAIFGIGLTRAPEAIARQAICAINLARERGATVLAVDLPSGLLTDSGRPLGDHVEADVTVTLGYAKRGLVIEPGCRIAGELVVADISIPRIAESKLTSRPVFMLTENGMRSVMPRRDFSSHKGTYGHVLVLAGSAGKTGAAAMTCAAAMRAGAGLVSLCGRADYLPTAQSYMPEIMAHALPGDGPLGLADLPALVEACRDKKVLAAGPGLFRGPETGELLVRLLEQVKLPAVLDADALNALAEAKVSLKTAQAPVVITPHPGEMARLTGQTIQAVQDDRLGIARAYSDAHKCTVILKGARTVIAEANGATAVNTTGNPGMATAGSGDVLTGMCAGLMAQGLTSGSAACVSVFVHGLAGDRVVKKRGMMGLVATDLIDAATEVWAEWGV